MLEWLAIFSFPPIPISSFPFPILFPRCLRFNSHSRPVTKICSHSLTNERHLSLNNQAMINVQNANTQLSQAKNLNSESPTVSVILSSTHNEMSRNFDRREFWHTHEIAAARVATVTPTLPISIPIFGTLVFPFPWDSRVNANPIHTHSSSQQRGFVATADTRLT